MPQPLTPQTIEAALETLAGWSHTSDALEKTWTRRDFKDALGFMVGIGLCAEQQNHHPELSNVYNTVKVRLNTHDAGNKVTQKDVDLALAIEGLAG